MIGKWIYAMLVAAAAVTALVGTRIRKGRARQNETLPYLVYRRTSTKRAATLTGPDGLPMPMVWIWCFAATSEAAEELADKVRTALDGQRGTAAGIFVQSCQLQDDSDDDEQPVHADEVGTPFILLQFRLACVE